MKQLSRILIAAVVAAAIATIVVQRDRLRQIDRAELVAQMRDAIESRRGPRSPAGEAPSVDAVEDSADEPAPEAAEEATVESIDAPAEK